MADGVNVCDNADIVADVERDGIVDDVAVVVVVASVLMTVFVVESVGLVVVVEVVGLVVVILGVVVIGHFELLFVVVLQLLLGPIFVLKQEPSSSHHLQPTTSIILCELTRTEK